MTGRDLENLKHMAVPPPSSDARARALAAALAEFADAQNSVLDRSQGNAAPARQTETSDPRRSFKMHMSSRSTLALAASVTALMIAAPLAFRHVRIETAAPSPPAVSAPVATSKDREASQLPPTVPAKPASNDAARSDSPDKKEDLKSSAPYAAQPSQAKIAEVAAPAPPAAAAAPTAVTGMPVASLERSAPQRSRARMQTEAGHISGYVNGPAYDQRRIVDAQTTISGVENRDKFPAVEQSPVKQVATDPVSTFSVDVDTASYSFARRALNAGHLPPKEAVRVEEMINYFPYAYPSPDTAGTPFRPTVTVMPSPWNANNKLVHVAIKGYDLKSAERPRANLVLLVDVSGSMSPADRLPLVKNAFAMLLDQLKPDDTIAIVTYASGSGIALEPTRAAEKNKILSALDHLQSGGSTAGAQGIQDAYRLAEAGFDKAAVNRIILATDGDFNVGITNQDELKGLIERKRQSGIFLSILGVGQGNHNDALMQTLAQNGNGTAAYVDTLNEARKVLVDEASSTLFTIAKDVKVQIEWNPERIAEYRLIGYETRALKREDFSNDKVDAGDIGSGHTITAIYDVTPVGAPVLADHLRYGKKSDAASSAAARRESEADKATDTKAGELGFLKLRYKRPNEDVSQLLSVPISETLTKSSMAEVPAETRFSVAVAAFGQLLKGSAYTQGYSYDDVIALAQPARGDDPFGYRAEFLNLVRLAKSARP